MIKFNRLIYFYNLRIISSADSTLITQETYTDSTITITWDDTLLSNDTLTVYLDSEFLDISGNPSNGTTSTTDESFVIFDNTKPELDIVRIASNNPDSTWAKVGDIISIHFVANEIYAYFLGTTKLDLEGTGHRVINCHSK